MWELLQQLIDLLVSDSRSDSRKEDMQPGARLCPECSVFMRRDVDKCSVCGWEHVPVLITEEMFLNGHHLNPEYVGEYDEEVKNNMDMLLTKVNSLLAELGIKQITVTSGWRPQAYNVKIGGARRSRHIIGQAIDLHDPDGSLKSLLQNNLDKLESRGLSMEHPDYTPTWCHLQCPPPRSGRVVFIPYAGPPRIKKK